LPRHILAWHSALLHELPVLGTRIVMLTRAKVSARQQHNDRKQVIRKVVNAKASTLRNDKATLSKIVQVAVHKQLKGQKGLKSKVCDVEKVGITTYSPHIGSETEEVEVIERWQEASPKERSEKEALQRFGLTSQEAEEVQGSAWFEMNRIPLDWLLLAFLED
ncbi:hypothetical protein PAXRUDRAFT_86693, partial [Paxillus rubicundulus Ve08.2h10]